MVIALGTATGSAACAVAGLAFLLWPDRRHQALAVLAPTAASRSPGAFGSRGASAGQRTWSADESLSTANAGAWPARKRRTGRSAAGGSAAPVRPPGSGAARTAVRSTAMVVLSGAGVVALTAMSVPVSWTVAGVLMTTTAWRLVRRARADSRTTADLREAAVALRALVRELQAGTRPSDAARRIAAKASARVAAILEPLADTAFRGANRMVSSGAVTVTAPSRVAQVGGPPDGDPPAVGAVGSSRGRPRPGSAIGDVAARLWAAWAVALRTGVPLAEVLSALAADVAARSAARQIRAAQVAGPAVSGYVLAALPLPGLLLGAGMGSDPLAVLGSGAVGGGLLVAGVALCCAGLVWTDRIVRGRSGG